MNHILLRSRRTAGLLFTCIFASWVSAPAINTYDPLSHSRSEHLEQTSIKLAPVEASLLSQSIHPLLILGSSAVAFFQELQEYLINEHSHDQNVQQLLDLSTYVVNGNRIVALQDYMKAIEYTLTLTDSSIFKRQGAICEIVACSLTNDNTYINNTNCDVYLCLDTLHQNRAVKPFQTVTASLRPPVHKLCVGTLFVTHRFCAQGPAIFLEKTFFKDDICVDPSATLSVDKIMAKTGTLELCGDVCISPEETFFVDKIAPKTEDGTTLFCGNVEVADDFDLRVNGRFIVPGVFVVSSTVDVMVDPAHCLFTNCIKPTDVNGTTTIQDIAVVDGEELRVNKIVAVSPGDAGDRDTSGSITVCSSICMEPHTTLSVHRICAKVTDTLAICSNVCIAEGMTLSVDRIAPKSDTSLDCVEIVNGLLINDDAGLQSIKLEGMTSGGGQIVLRQDGDVTHNLNSPPSGGGLIEIKGADGTSKILLNASNSIFAPGVSACGGGFFASDLCVSGSVVTDVLEAKTTGTVRITSNVCIDTGMTLSVDRICAKTDDDAIQICDDLCIVSSHTLFVETIKPKNDLLILDASADTIILIDEGMTLRELICDIIDDKMNPAP